MLITVHSGSAAGVTFAHVFPPSRDKCIKPSSEPAQKTPGSWGDSTKAKIVA